MSTGEFRLLVCGGRDYADRAVVFTQLDDQHSLAAVDGFRLVIIEGGATGADALAREWAKLKGVECRTFPANWAKHGRAAGPLRNARMITEGQPHRVAAFPGGRGTDDMIRRALAARIPTFKFISP